jgi:RNA polymerase sigma-70 factor (ECF subfamily)
VKEGQVVGAIGAYSMNEHDWLAEQFEAHRSHLRAVAYRILGSRSEAEDAVQEAWLRIGRSDAGAVDNLGGWLTTVVGRICLNMLRARRTRREEALDVHGAKPLPSDENADPAEETLFADSVGVALLVVLDTLEPAERLAFVLHDLLGMPFEEIGPIVDRSPVAARQLASRARRRVRQASPTSRPDLGRQREVVDAFLVASRTGDFAALLGLLDPNVVLRADHVAVAATAGAQAQGAPALEPELHGRRAVADAFAGRARGAQPALIDGAAGAAWAPSGVPRAAFVFTIVDGKIVAIEVLSDPEHLSELDLQILA